MSRETGGHIVSWSLRDQKLGVMLAHSFARRKDAAGNEIPFDPVLPQVTEVMSRFFQSPMVEAHLAQILDEVMGEPVKQLELGVGNAEAE